MNNNDKWLRYCDLLFSDDSLGFWLDISRMDVEKSDFEEFKDLNEEEVKEKIKEKYKIMEEYYLENSENLYKKSEVAIINGTNKLNKSEEIEV